MAPLLVPYVKAVRHLTGCFSNFPKTGQVPCTSCKHQKVNRQHALNTLLFVLIYLYLGVGNQSECVYVAFWNQEETGNIIIVHSF